MIRQFELINTNGETWELTDKTFHCFLSSPQGLGFNRTVTATRYGNIQNLSDITDDFPSPSGEILFYDSANEDRYTKYYNFCRFLSYSPLILKYKIPWNASPYYKEYSLDCVCTSLSKGETNEEQILSCSIQFQGLSFWRGENIIRTTDSYRLGLTNDGDFPVGLEVQITGSLVNPYFYLENMNYQTPEIYGEAKFTDATAFTKVYVDSKDGEQDIVLEQGGSPIANPLGYQDLSISNGAIYVTFIKLIRGESRITIGYDSGSLTRTEIFYTPLYRSI